MNTNGEGGVPAPMALLCYLLAGAAASLSFFTCPPAVLVAFASACVVTACFLIAHYGLHGGPVGCLLVVLTLAFVWVQDDRKLGEEPLIRLRR